MVKQPKLPFKSTSTTNKKALSFEEEMNELNKLMEEDADEYEKRYYESYWGSEE